MLLVFIATFNNISVILGSVVVVIVWQLDLQLYRDGQFYRWMKPEYPEITTDLPQVTRDRNPNPFILLVLHRAV
jgi:hypothetical protein